MPNRDSTQTEKELIEASLAELGRMITGKEREGLSLAIHTKTALLLKNAFDISNNQSDYFSGEVKALEVRHIKDIEKIKANCKEEAKRFEARIAAIESLDIKPLPLVFWLFIKYFWQVLGAILTLATGISIANWQKIVEILSG